MDWMRNAGVKPDDEEVPAFNKLASIPVARRSPEDRVMDLEDVMTWMRNGKNPDDDPTGEFKKLDQMLPMKKKQPKEQRGRDIEAALDWVRSKSAAPMKRTFLQFSLSLVRFLFRVVHLRTGRRIKTTP
jgi:hypothetical protein